MFLQCSSHLGLSTFQPILTPNLDPSDSSKTALISSLYCARISNDKLLFPSGACQIPASGYTSVMCPPPRHTHKQTLVSKSLILCLQAKSTPIPPHPLAPRTPPTLRARSCLAQLLLFPPPSAHPPRSNQSPTLSTPRGSLDLGTTDILSQTILCCGAFLCTVGR